MLKDLIIQYLENRKINSQKEINQNSKFKTFISSFITDLLVFIVAILTVLIMFIIIYMFAGQSKLKKLVANIALQHVKAIDALNTNNQKQYCDIGMLKFLMILNLIMVIIIILVKIKKSRIFQGQFFSNMLKIKLFLVDTESYVPLELNNLAGNVHLFKLTEVSLDIVTLKKNWKWDVLEVNWNNVHITSNEKEVNLPGH